MGFIAERSIFVLQFEDPALKGLEVRCTSMSLDAFLAMLGLAEVGAKVQDMTRDEALAAISPDDLHSTARLFDGFAEHLVSWNLQDRDPKTGEVRAVPATRAGMGSQDVGLMLNVARAWQDTIAGVPAPLADGSPSGVTSPEPSLPMEPLSPSRAS